MVKVYCDHPWVLQIENGAWKENCYLVYAPDGQCVVVDPGDCDEDINQEIDRLELQPLAIFCTHAHFDHVGAAAMIARKHKIPIYLHEADFTLLKYANAYKAAFGAGKPMPVTHIDQALQGGENLKFGDIDVKVHHLPGHTDGSCCFLINGMLFSGDIVFQNKVGDADRLHGSETDLSASIETLKAMKYDEVVFPGHGAPFLIKDSKWV